MTAQPPAPDWYPDRTGKPGLMYWDGQQWRTDVPATASPANQPPHQIGTPPPAPFNQWPGGPQRSRSPILVMAVITGVAVLALVGVTAYFVWPHPHPNQTAQPSTTTQASVTTPPVPPVAEAALDGLLLSPDQINIAMGATGMTSSQTYTDMVGDSSVADKACRSVNYPTGGAAYRGSAFSALRLQRLQESGDNFTNPHQVGQAVVLFSSAHDADAFFTASAQQWAACSNRQYTFTVAGKPDQVWTVGPVSNTNGTLSATKTLLGGGDSSWTWYRTPCQRALIVANNVVIDVSACSQNPSDAAVNIAHQIAAKVPD